VEYYLNLYVSRADEWGIVPQDHQYASEQFLLPFHAEAASAGADHLALVNIQTEGKDLTVSGEDFTVVFDMSAGVMKSFRTGDQEFLRSGPQPDFWRAPTDNDYGNGMEKRNADWKEAGRNTVLKSAQISQPGMNSAEISFTFDVPGQDKRKIASLLTTYLVHDDGTVDVSFSLTKTDLRLEEIPRVGMQMTMPDRFTNLAWYGRGPHENYNDRKTSAFVGMYESSVAEQYVPYVRPQENGYRTETRWLTVTDNTGTGLRFEGFPVFSFAALNYLHEDFESPGRIAGYRPDAKLVNTHIDDVNPRDLVCVNIDYGQMGVGGDDSWGARTHEKYCLRDARYNYSFRIIPVTRSK
jgi:beta-galactosidase